MSSLPSVLRPDGKEIKVSGDLTRLRDKHVISFTQGFSLFTRKLTCGAGIFVQNSC
jgi:hypothetical protein